jgi:hypothetical protein
MPYLPRYSPGEGPQCLEYKRISGQGDHVEAELNGLAQEGWELVAADGGWLYLGRVKSD